MDLRELDEAVSRRARAWHGAGARWDIVRGPLSDKPASSQRMEKGDALDELILWVSGEVELNYTRRMEDPPMSQRYNVEDAVGLNGILHELEDRVGLRRDPSIQPVLPFPDEPPRS